MNLVGTGADFDLLLVDEAPGLVRTDGYVVGWAETKDHRGGEVRTPTYSWRFEFALGFLRHPNGHVDGHRDPAA
ncbi:MAG: hypothetical protein ACR2NT_06675 [Acidimicrobiia bacterium]